MKKRIVLVLVYFITWCLLNWPPDWQHLTIGILAAVFCAFVTGDLFVVRSQILKHPLRFWYFLFNYLPKFAWECFKANFDLAQRLVFPRLPLNPGIVKVKTSLKTDIALTFLANSITLAPGTLTVDISKDDGVLYVHCLEVKDTDTKKATQVIAAGFEKVLLKIFE